MKCPSCSGADLLITDRQGIEIDYCPRCRGVWLDRGELDKLIERMSTYRVRDDDDRDDDDDDDEGDRRRRRSEDRYQAPPPRDGGGQPAPGYPPPTEHHPKKRKSFWGELFDFD